MSKNFMEDLIEKYGVIGGAIFGVIIIFITGIILGYPIMLLWNYVMPYLFGLPLLTYWRAVALFFLCDLLIKGGKSL